MASVRPAARLSPRRTKRCLQKHSDRRGICLSAQHHWPTAGRAHEHSRENVNQLDSWTSCSITVTAPHKLPWTPWEQRWWGDKEWREENPLTLEQPPRPHSRTENPIAMPFRVFVETCCMRPHCLFCVDICCIRYSQKRKWPFLFAWSLWWSGIKVHWWKEVWITSKGRTCIELFFYNFPQNLSSELIERPRLVFSLFISYLEGDLWTRLANQYTVHHHHGGHWYYVSQLYNKLGTEKLHLPGPVTLRSETYICLQSGFLFWFWFFFFFAINTNIVWFQVEAVKLIAEGKAPRITQPQEGATYECIQKKDNAKVIQTEILKLIFSEPYVSLFGYNWEASMRS